MTERRRTETLQERIHAWTSLVVALSIVGMCWLLTWYVLQRAVPAGNETIVGQLLGQLLTLLGVVAGFFYVASRGSQKKDEALADMAKTAQAAGATLAAKDAPEALVIPPGGSATATSTDDGTIIAADRPA